MVSAVTGMRLHVLLVLVSTCLCQYSPRLHLLRQYRDPRPSTYEHLDTPLERADRHGHPTPYGHPAPPPRYGAPSTVPAERTTIKFVTETITAVRTVENILTETITATQVVEKTETETLSLTFTQLDTVTSTKQVVSTVTETSTNTETLTATETTVIPRTVTETSVSVSEVTITSKAKCSQTTAPVQQTKYYDHHSYADDSPGEDASLPGHIGTKRPVPPPLSPSYTDNSKDLPEEATRSSKRPHPPPPQAPATDTTTRKVIEVSIHKDQPEDDGSIYNFEEDYAAVNSLPNQRFGGVTFGSFDGYPGFRGYSFKGFDPFVGYSV